MKCDDCGADAIMGNPIECPTPNCTARSFSRTPSQVPPEVSENTAQEMARLIVEMEQRSTNSAVPERLVAQVLAAACAAIADLDARLAKVEATPPPAPQDYCRHADGKETTDAKNV